MRAGLIHDSELEFGVRLAFEAGLRDANTAPVSSETRRIARILSLDLDVFEGEMQTHLVLIGMHIDRDLPGVFGAGSSGFEIGYTDRLNFAGTSGPYVESWSGFAFRLPSESWFSVRLNLRVDEIHDQPSLRVLPTFSGSTSLDGLHLEATVVSDLGDLGCRLAVSRDLAFSIFSIGLEREPQGGRRLDFSVSRRF